METIANLLLSVAGLLALLALILGATGGVPRTDGVRAVPRIWWMIPLAVLLMVLAIALGATPFLKG